MEHRTALGRHTRLSQAGTKLGFFLNQLDNSLEVLLSFKPHRYSASVQKNVVGSYIEEKEWQYVQDG